MNTHAYCNGRGSARGRGRSDCGMGMPRRMSRVVSAPCCGCIPRHLESASELGQELVLVRHWATIEIFKIWDGPKSGPPRAAKGEASAAAAPGVWATHTSEPGRYGRAAVRNETICIARAQPHTSGALRS